MWKAAKLKLSMQFLLLIITEKLGYSWWSRMISKQEGPEGPGPLT